MQSKKFFCEFGSVSCHVPIKFFEFQPGFCFVEVYFENWVRLFTSVRTRLDDWRQLPPGLDSNEGNSPPECREEVRNVRQDWRSFTIQPENEDCFCRDRGVLVLEVGLEVESEVLCTSLCGRPYCDDGWVACVIDGNER